MPWFLTGGPTPDNILDALNHAYPSGVDLSSGAEFVPGDKDINKVVKLFNNLKSKFAL